MTEARPMDELRRAAEDVVIQEGRYYERDGSGESPFLAVVPKAAIAALRVALAARSGPGAEGLREATAANLPAPLPPPNRSLIEGTPENIAWHKVHDDSTPAADSRGLDVERLARAWLNAMPNGEHNAGCLDQGAFDCPVGAEVRDFVPLVAREYAALTDPDPAP